MGRPKKETPEDKMVHMETPEKRKSEPKEIQIRIKKVIRGIGFSYDPGQIVTVEFKFGKSLIKEKAAEEI